MSKYVPPPENHAPALSYGDGTKAEGRLYETNLQLSVGQDSDHPTLVLPKTQLIVNDFHRDLESSL